MKKTHLELLQEEVELAKQGKIRYEPDPPFVVVRDPKNLEKRLEELRRLNDYPPRKINSNTTHSKSQAHVEIRVSKAAYTRIAQKARRQKMDVTEYVEKTLAK